MSYVSDSDRKSCDASDIVCRMSVILAGRVVILVILYVETFKTVVIVLISNIIMCLTSNRLIIFSIRVSYFMLRILLNETEGEMFKLLIHIVIYWKRIYICGVFIFAIYKLSMDPRKSIPLKNSPQMSNMKLFEIEKPKNQSRLLILLKFNYRIYIYSKLFGDCKRLENITKKTQSNFIVLYVFNYILLISLKFDSQCYSFFVFSTNSCHSCLFLFWILQVSYRINIVTFFCYSLFLDVRFYEGVE
jgi:hypothetical protein